MSAYLCGYYTSEKDFALYFEIPGKPAVLKNSKVIVTKPMPRLVPSKASAAWTKSAVDALNTQKPFNEPLPSHVHVQVAIATYAHDKRKRDLDNALAGPLDALVAARILSDDSQVKSLDGSRMNYDKRNPRVEIIIKPYSQYRHRRWAAWFAAVVKQAKSGGAP